MSTCVDAQEALEEFHEPKNGFDEYFEARDLARREREANRDEKNIAPKVKEWLQQQCLRILPPNGVQGPCEAMTVFRELMLNFSPKSAVEGMLFAQLVTVHLRAFDCFDRANLSSQKPKDDYYSQKPKDDYYTNRAMQFVKLSLQLADGLKRQQGEGTKQHVTVQHVHVNDGAQAIVGAVAGAQSARHKTRNKTRHKK